MNLLKKIAVSVSTVAIPAAMLFGNAAVVKGATAGGVYKTPDGTVWFVTKDMQKRPFTSAGAFLSYGFLNFSQVMDADASVTSLPTGSFIPPADGKIFCATETKGSDVAGECSLITGGKKAAFTSAAVFAAQGFSFSRAMYGDSSFLSKTANIDNGSAAHLPGVLINNGGTVQMVVSGGLWGIPSIEVFNSWGYSFADVVPANSADTAKSQIGVIPARMPGELVPTATSNPTPGPGSASCPNDGTEGDVDAYTLGSPQDTTIAEGEDKKELIAYDVELSDDGDLCLNRFDIYMGELNGGSQSSRPWDYFTEAFLMVNGQQVASMDVDSSSAWTKYSGNALATTSQEYRLRFSGLNVGLKADEVNTVSVAFSAVNNLDSSDLNATWQYGTEADSFRFTDGTGFSFTGGNASIDSSFTVKAADKASLKIAANVDDPDASIIQVKDSADTNGKVIGIFDIEEVNDVSATITKMNVVLASPSGETITNMVSKLYLYDGNTLIAQKNVSGATVTFDNIDLDISGDEKVAVTVKADFKDTNNQSRYQDGDNIRVGSVDLVEYEDEFGNDESDIGAETGSYQGEIHTLYVNGMEVSIVGTPTTTINTNTGAGNDSVEFQWVFDVTAFGSKDVYINKDIADIVTSAGALANNVDTIYSWQKSAGANLTALGGTIVRTSGPNTDVTGAGGYTDAPYSSETFFRIAPGTTHRFTLTVSGVNQTDSKQVRAMLDNIEWTTDEVANAAATGAATIRDYTVGLGTDAATPFKLID